MPPTHHALTHRSTAHQPHDHHHQELATELTDELSTKLGLSVLSCQVVQVDPVPLIKVKPSADSNGGGAGDGDGDGDGDEDVVVVPGALAFMVKIADLRGAVEANSMVDTIEEEADADTLVLPDKYGREV